MVGCFFVWCVLGFVFWVGDGWWVRLPAGMVGVVLCGFYFMISVCGCLLWSNSVVVI